MQPDPVPAKGQGQFAVVQTWKATTPGSRTILVRAANERGATGEAGITVNEALILAVSASNCDLHVTVIQATTGQVGMTDAHIISA